VKMFGAVASSSGLGGGFITSNNNSVLRIFRLCFPFSSGGNEPETCYKDEVS
jgi:hypothetical protein